MENVNEKVWVDVEKLSENFSEFRLPQTSDLSGKEVVLNYKGGYSVTYNFVDGCTLRATYKNGEETEVVGATYDAAELRKGVYFFDYVWSYGLTKSISTVIDFNQGMATTLVSILPTLEEAKVSTYERYLANEPMTSVKAIWDHAAVDAPFTSATKVHPKTTKLVGERLQFNYSSTDAYEHIYLCEDMYTWHCILGVEKGLADTDKCFFYDLGDDLVWFTWLEKIVPTVGVVIEDFKAMRSYGKLYGYKNRIEDEAVINTPTASYAHMLNKTEYK